MFLGLGLRSEGWDWTKSLEMSCYKGEVPRSTLVLPRAPAPFLWKKSCCPSPDTTYSGCSPVKALNIRLILWGD